MADDQVPAPGTIGRNTISRAELGAYYRRLGYSRGGDAAAAVFDDITARRQPYEPAGETGARADPPPPVAADLDSADQPGRWRRKSETVEALHWDGAPVTASVIIDWILAAGGTARYHDGPSYLVIDIPGGTVNAVPGDWIIKCLDGTFRRLEEADFLDLHELAGVLVSDDSALADARNTIGQATVMVESMAEGGQISPECARRLLSTLGTSPRDLEAIGTGPLLDPDCRAGKCASCVGAPCEHECHGSKSVIGSKED